MTSTSPFDEDEEGVAFVAFADDPRAGSEGAHEAFLRDQVLRRVIGSGQHRHGRERVEERGSGGDHLLEKE